MSLINTAITGLRVSQLNLSVAGHNIVNANTSGYSRQSINTSTALPTQTGVGYVGNGVLATDIFRNTEQYLVDRISQDISELSELDTYLSNVTTLDNLFAGDKSNLSISLNKFFDAVNTASNDPSSLLGRQLLLTETSLLTANIKQLDDRLVAQQNSINTQLTAVASSITGIGAQIGALNKAISEASGGGIRQMPNDLLDKRDELVRELSRYVDVVTMQREDGSIDVSIGQGQPLVSGADSRQLVTVPGSAEAARFELAFKTGLATAQVSKLMSGGELGGLLRIRGEALDPAINALGRIALAISAQFNEQHQLGVDLEGNLGGKVFQDINHASIANDRVRAYAGNSNADRWQIDVSIDDVAKLGVSNYELQFSGPNGRYSVIRLDDGRLMSQGLLGNALPQNIEVEGFSIEIKAGSFENGDRFLIQPMRSAAARMQSLIRRPEEFALASPIRSSAAAGNQGGAFVRPGDVSSVSTAAFSSKSGSLSPPILIRFTSATRYDVLDYSNPANPVALKPPLMNQAFTPGVEQKVFPEDPGGTTVQSLGAAAAQVQFNQLDNGYPQETLSIQSTDPETGFIREQQLTLNANQSAAVTAAQLSALTGVRANASSQVLLSDFTSGSGGEALSLSLNGVLLTDPDIVAPGQSLPQQVPNPLTADFLRERINSSESLQAQGVFASSDGESLWVRSSTGVDLQFSLDGADAAVSVSRAPGEAAVVFSGPALPGDPPREFSIGGSIDLQLAAGSVLTSDTAAGLFGTAPQALSNYMGYQLVLGSGSGADGRPQAGDSFVIAYNSEGSADNRNGMALLALSSATQLAGGQLSYQGAYGQLVEELGILTSQTRLSQAASESMLRQSMDALSSVAGVNIEEEAARLIQFEQHYNASARLIALARDLFDTLLGM